MFRLIYHQTEFRSIFLYKKKNNFFLFFWKQNLSAVRSAIKSDWKLKLRCPSDSRLSASLGVPPEPLNTIVLWCLMGFGGASIGPPLVPRGANLSDMSVCLIVWFFQSFIWPPESEHKPTLRSFRTALIQSFIDGKWELSSSHREMCFRFLPEANFPSDKRWRPVPLFVHLQPLFKYFLSWYLTAFFFTF